MSNDPAARIAERCEPWLALLGRLAIAVIFLGSGPLKLMNIPGFAALLATMGLPMPFALAVLAGVVESLGSLAIALGFKTRYAALLMILFVVIATLLRHNYWMLEGAARAAQHIQFMKNLAIAGGLLLLYAHGPGRISIDGMGKRAV